MGDISEYRGLIFCGTLLIIAVFFIGLIPSDFLVSYDDPDRNPSIPDYLDAQTIFSWNNTYSLWWGNLTYSAVESLWYDAWGGDEIGHDMLFGMHNLTDQYFYLQHGDYPWWGLGGFNPWHNMNWVNSDGTDRGEYVYLDELEEDLGSGSSTNYKVSCVDFYMTCNVGYNSTAFNNVTSAWDHDGMGIVFGIEWDQEGSSFNAFSIASSFLSFDASITGNIVVDTLIRAPLLIAGAYIAFILVLRAIGAVFGGGA